MLQNTFLSQLKSNYVGYIHSIEMTMFIFVVYATTLSTRERSVFILEESAVCSTKRWQLSKRQWKTHYAIWLRARWTVCNFHSDENIFFTRYTQCQFCKFFSTVHAGFFWLKRHVTSVCRLIWLPWLKIWTINKTELNVKKTDMTSSGL